VKFPKIEGIPEKFAFGQQIFALKKDRAVVPHGHNNMATAFLISSSRRGRVGSIAAIRAASTLSVKT